MACILSSGYTLPCRVIAGVQAVYIGTYNSGLTYTYGTSSNANQIISFAGSTSSFYKFEQTIETGSLTNTGNFNEQNGTAYYDQVCEITVHNVSQTLIDQVTSLGQGRWRILVLDNNGNYFLIGKSFPVSVTALTGGLGKADGDLQGFTITFTGKEKEPMIQATSTAVAGIIA